MAKHGGSRKGSGKKTEFEKPMKRREVTLDMKQCPTCGETYEVTKSCPCPVRGGARRGAGKKPIYKQALTRANVSLDPATIAFYKRHGSSLSDGIRQYWRGLTKREPDSSKAGVLSLPDTVKSESNLPA